MIQRSLQAPSLKSYENNWVLRPQIQSSLQDDWAIREVQPPQNTEE